MKNKILLPVSSLKTLALYNGLLFAEPSDKCTGFTGITLSHASLYNLMACCTAPHDFTITFKLFVLYSKYVVSMLNWLLRYVVRLRITYYDESLYKCGIMWLADSLSPA